MEKNFYLANATTLKCDDQCYDLHNCYDLVGIKIDFSERYVEILFAPFNKTSSEKIPGLVISFFKVDHFDISPEMLRKMVSDVLELGYKNPNDVDHNWLMSENKKSGQDHLFIRLAGDEFIRVHGASAKIHLLPANIDTVLPVNR